MPRDRDYEPERLAELFDVASAEELEALVRHARRVHTRDPELTPWECCNHAWEASRT